MKCINIKFNQTWSFYKNFYNSFPLKTFMDKLASSNVMLKNSHCFEGLMRRCESFVIGTFNFKPTIFMSFVIIGK